MSRPDVGTAASRRLSSWAGLPSATEGKPPCIEFWPEIRYRGYGYDHVVHLDSRCNLVALCKVSTDVNPNAIDVVVPAREHVEVLTFRGSPARRFTPRVTCQLRR